jgi:alpha-beta hydrolase superfamily lysophospholipase
LNFRGIVRGAVSVLDRALPALRKALESKSESNRRLVVTGHSLGGASAEIITMLLLGEPEKHHLPKGTKVEAVYICTINT